MQDEEERAVVYVLVSTCGFYGQADILKSQYTGTLRDFFVARALTFGNFRQPADGAGLSSEKSACIVTLHRNLKKNIVSLYSKSTRH